MLLNPCCLEHLRTEDGLDAITDAEKRKQFVAAWQDGRSSLNDIGSFAHKMAKHLREMELK